MNHKTQTYTAEQAAKMAKEVGDFDSSPKHLKREILALKKRVAALEGMVRTIRGTPSNFDFLGK